MNTNIQTYLDIQSKVTRIDNLTNADWDLEYAFEKLGFRLIALRV